MGEQIRTFVSLLGLIGIPSIFSLAMWCYHECRKFAKSISILHAAQKAQMRSQLLEQYYNIKVRGYVYDDELTEWINQFDAYHELVGNNAILDTRKDELLTFPSRVR